MSGHTAMASEKLRALCVGHPSAKIAWPHRDLHEAAATIDELVEALKTTAGNIRSLGPAGAMGASIAYRDWLDVVDAALAKAGAL